MVLLLLLWWSGQPTTNQEGIAVDGCSLMVVHGHWPLLLFVVDRFLLDQSIIG